MAGRALGGRPSRDLRWQKYRNEINGRAGQCPESVPVACVPGCVFRKGQEKTRIEIPARLHVWQEGRQS